MISVTHPLLEMLISKQSYLQLTDRKFAIEYLNITEDTYSNWKRNFPTRLTEKSLKGISETLDMSVDEIREFL